VSTQTEGSTRKGWKWVTLADVAKVVTGNTPPTGDARNYGDAIPFVKPTELVDRGIRFAPAGLADQALGKARVVPAGAVLVSCIGNLGKTGLAKVPVAFNQQINAVVFNENVVPEFGFYYAQTLKSWLYGESSATTLPIINKGKFQQAPFPVAPIAEQREIVAELEKQFSRLDEAVANLQRVKANLKRYKASVLKDAVEGRLVPTEAELARREGRSFETGEQLLQRILEARRSQWKGKGKYKGPATADRLRPLNLGTGWCWASAEEVCRSVRDGTHDTPKYVAEGVPLITSKNLTDDGIDFSDVKLVSETDHAEISKRSSVAIGDVLFAMIGTVGNPCEVKTTERFSIKNVGLFKANPGFLDSTFLCYWLQSSPLNRWLDPRLKGTTQRFAPLGLLRELPVALPPLVEQARIVAEVDRRLSLVRQVEAEVNVNLKRAQSLRQATLTNAFGGKAMQE
jgi:type I restriction enzyme S subunit